MAPSPRPVTVVGMRDAMRSGGHGLLALAALLALLGCPGGGGGSSSSSGGSIRISGSVVYERVPPTTDSGLDYTATVEAPVRGATLRVLDSRGDLVDRGVLDAQGRFALDAPRDSTFTLEVLAQLGDPDAPEVVIRDNTSGNGQYIAEVHVAARSSDARLSVVIPSGWTGSSYGDQRAAAPFAILDVIYDGRALVREARPDFDFVDQSVFWSPDNTTSSSINYAAGLIRTSHYRPSTGGVYLLGDEDLDAAVVAHEWIHYFEDRHARSDSVGGSHSASFGAGSMLTANSILDDTIAFGEGFATAMGGIINGDADYIDTMGSQQGTTAIYFDLEQDSMSDSLAHADGRLYDGYWSEFSVMEIVWDLADGADDDGAAIGASTLIEALLDGQADTPYFTSIYTFLHHLKALPEVDATDDSTIDALADAENVFAGNEYQATDAGTPSGYRRYTTLSDDGTLVTTDMDGNTLESRTTYGSTGNRLFNRVFFRGIASSAGTHTIKAWPTDDSLDMRVWQPGDATPSVLSDPYEWTVDLAAGELLVFAIEWRSGSSAAADDFDIGWFAPGTVVPKISN